MRIMKTLLLLSCLGLAACKTTPNSNEEGMFELKDLVTDRFTVTEPMTLTPELTTSLKQMAGNQDVCAGKFSNKNNIELAGIYLCVMAQGEDKLSSSTALPLVLAQTYSDASGSYRVLTKDGYSVGRLKQVAGKWQLVELCRTDTCTVSYTPTGFVFTWNKALDPAKWTYKLMKREMVEDQAATVLQNVSGIPYCFGRIQFDMGWAFAIYPCNKPLSPYNIKIINIEGGMVAYEKYNLFYFQGKYIGSGWVWRKNEISLRELCQKHYGSGTVQTCHITYDPKLDNTTIHWD